MEIEVTVPCDFKKGDKMLLRVRMDSGNVVADILPCQSQPQTPTNPFTHTPYAPKPSLPRRLFTEKNIEEEPSFSDEKGPTPPEGDY